MESNPQSPPHSKCGVLIKKLIKTLKKVWKLDQNSISNNYVHIIYFKPSIPGNKRKISNPEVL